MTDFPPRDGYFRKLFAEEFTIGSVQFQNLNIPGNVSAGTLDVTGQATVGSLVSNGSVTADSGTFANGVTVSSLGAGVVQSDSSGALSASNGT